MLQPDLLKSLHPLEIKVLLSGLEVLDAPLIVEKLDYKLGHALQSLSWLSMKNLVQETDRKTLRFYELTDLGRVWLAEGFPEAKLLRAVASGKRLPLSAWTEELDLEQSELGSAFGRLSKEGFLGLDSEKNVIPLQTEEPAWFAIVRHLLDRASKQDLLAETDLGPEELSQMQAMARKRGASGAAFKVVERDEVRYQLTDLGREVREQLRSSGLSGEEAGALTPEMLRGGEWKKLTFRAYNIRVPPTRVLMGRKNPYTEFLRQVKDKLVSLGFEEFDGPLVETEFWNGDALFMPQFHSARDIHDVYYIREPTHARHIEEPWLSQVAAAHENGGGTGSRGWGYRFDHDFTRRLILRSQGTVLSAKQLPRARVPGKYFGVVRCFRYDQVDATHGADFYQTEGIVLGEEVNLRTLLGLLEMFAVEVAGATDVKYVPGYFPFTEPSIEVHIRHPVLGWFELGGSGIFRPEVTRPLGVEVPVLAWGLGIDRMALMQLGLNDLRELFTPDIEKVRLRRAQGA